MIAAGRAAELGAGVLLLEKTERPGKKLLVSGHARCNLTNARPLEQFLPMYGPNGRFLRAAFRSFFREELLALLGRYGVETKAEPDGRIFLASDDAHDIVRVLERYLADGGVAVRTGEGATAIALEGRRVAGLRTREGLLPARAVVLATGGASYPGTGSSGDGYRMAAALGHTIVPLRPALVPIVVNEVELAAAMQGVSLRDVRLTAFRLPAGQVDPTQAPPADVGGRGVSKRAKPPVIESRRGDLLFTHFGLGGPIVLLMSLAVVDALAEGPVSLAIDLLPDRPPPEASRWLQRQLDERGKRSVRSILRDVLPDKMVEPLLALAGVVGEKQGSQVTAEERERLLCLLKSLSFDVAGSLPLAAATVTAGGVSLKDVDPATMESRLVKGLFFCGEVLDLDADTGGYNLQAAFSTGYLAGESAARLR